MDKDFNNYVTFKDFCKFVKKHAKGEAYDLVDLSDSSFSWSSSEAHEDNTRDYWKIMDPERRCVVSIPTIIQFMDTHFGLGREAAEDMVVEDAAKQGLNRDSMVTYKQFCKILKETESDSLSDE